MSGQRRVASPRGHSDPGKQSSGLQLALPAEVLDQVAERAAAIVIEQLREELAPAPSPWLDVAGAAEYIAAPVSRIYALVSADRIPFHRDGSRLLFHRDELDAWIRDGGGKRP
jgi:excisionase family DNA binding protein